MTKYECLHEAIRERDITIVRDDSQITPSASLRDGEDCYIFFNEKHFQTAEERTVVLAHEFGHCDTGTFYTLLTPLMTRGRCEYRADKNAVRRLVPLRELSAAVSDGIVECWELAERFGVTEGFIQKALDVYARAGARFGTLPE